VQPWYVDDVAGRFKAYGWNVVGPVDGHDVDAVDAAMPGQGQRHRPRW
jgi:transketolase